MKVIFEIQHLFDAEFRGVPLYTTTLIKTLYKRGNNQYALTFFDKDKQRNNKERYVDPLFGELGIQYYECNELSYQTIQKEFGVLPNKSYNEYTGAYGDIFHFTAPVFLPDKIHGKTVVTVHDMLPMQIPQFWSENWQTVFATSIERIETLDAIVITDSLSTKSDLLKLSRISPDNTYVVYPGYDEGILYPDGDRTELYKLGIDVPYILYLAAIDPRKGIDKILLAYEVLASKYNDIKLVIAGSIKHADESLLAKIRSHAFTNRIITTDYVTEEQRRILMSNALVFLFPSLYEGFGLPVLEAMACGCPVITSNNSSLPEVVGDAGVLIDAESVEQLIYETDKLLTSETMREGLRDKGIIRAKMFTWEKTAEETEKIYDIAIRR